MVERIIFLQHALVCSLSIYCLFEYLKREFYLVDVLIFISYSFKMFNAFITMSIGIATTGFNPKRWVQLQNQEIISCGHPNISLTSTYFYLV